LIIHPRSNESVLSSLFGWRQREQSALGAMASDGEGAQTQDTGHKVRQGFFLHDLEVERDTFCKLMAKETVDGGWVTVAQFDQHLAMVRVASGEALAPRFAPVVVVQAGPPPPSIDLARECFGKTNRWW
jgi:hypothetical protein